MNTRRARAVATILVGVLAIGAVAWRTGASAVHYASDPSREPCPALTPGDHVLTIDTPQGSRQVRLHVPPKAYRPRALVLALHGAGQTGADTARNTGFSRLANRENFLVAYPSVAGPHALWNMSGRVAGNPNAVRGLERSLDQLESSACVDDARVFVAGVFSGGGRAARVGCMLSARFAGIAAVADRSAAPPPCKPERPLPVLEIHRTGSRSGSRSIVRWLGQWRRIDGCRGKASRIVPAPGVSEIVWRACAEGTRVENVWLGGAAHGRPGGHATKPPAAPFAATWRTWEFFRSLPPRPPV